MSVSLPGTITFTCSKSHIISPYNITRESHIMGHGNKGNDYQLRAFDCQTSSPCQKLRKHVENSMVNMHADIQMSWCKGFTLYPLTISQPAAFQVGILIKRIYEN